MRRYLQIGLASVVIATLLLSAVQAGPLTPPAGPVAGTGPTQIFALPFTISTPGSYIVARDLTGVAAQHGITINASGVTLDLGGFTLHGVPGSLNGIFMPGFGENVVIQNGAVRNWGADGIFARIDVGRIERISAANNGGLGIYNGGATFSSHIISCEVSSNGSVGAGGGIQVGSNSSITDCIVNSNIGVGISGGANVTVENTTSTSNRGSGFLLDSGAVVRGCTASNNLAPQAVVQASPSSPADYKNPGAQVPTSKRPDFVEPFADYVNPVNIDERTGAVIPGLVNFGAGTEGVLTGSDGFQLGVGSTIEGCSASGNNDDGIAVGLGSTVVNCTTSNNTGNGIIADDGTTVQTSTSRGNTGAGIVMDANGHVRDCTADNNTGDGIVASSMVTIFGNTVSGNTGNGIVVNGLGCRVDSNHIVSNIGDGIQLNSIRSIVVRNQLAFNNININGLIVSNTIGPTNDLTNPWSNFIP